MTIDAERDVATFESLRSELVGLAYRMLGDVARAEDMVQEAWLRWHARDRSEVIASARAFLVTIVTRLCLNELDSARARREESRGDRLPEPVDLADPLFERVAANERISMAFLVVLQKLTPAERTVVILHDVFDMPHEDVASLLERTPAACRKLLERARDRVAASRAMIETPREEHERLLGAFVRAVSSGDMTNLLAVLAPAVTIVTDGGAEGRTVGRIRNLREPLVGAEPVARFLTNAARNASFTMVHRELNGRPAIVFLDGDRPAAAMLLGVENAVITRVFFCGDVARLGHVVVAGEGTRENTPFSSSESPR